MYAVKNGFGLFKSANAGESWRFLHGSEVDYTYAIAVDPRNSDIVYSGYNPKPFQDRAMVRRSLDGGTNWETVLEVHGSKGITTLAIDTADPRIIYAGSVGTQGGKIFKSIDGGENWQELNPSFNMCTVWGQPQLVCDPFDPSMAYVGTWLAGTWRTLDGGETWELLENAPVSATSLCLDELSRNTIYLTDRTSPKVWKSGDRGVTWELIGDFSRDGAFLANRVYAAGITIYAATFGPGIHGGKLYKSSNGGDEWEDITGALPRSVLDIAVHPDNPQILYVTTHVHGAYRSEDGGRTWRRLDGFPDIGAYDIEVDAADPRTLYACGLGDCTVPDWCMPASGYTFTDKAGVYQSRDGGESWSQILVTSNECRAVRIHPENSQILLAASMDDGLLVSLDGGRTWTEQNTGPDTLVLTSLAVAGEYVYAGSQACGVFAGTVTPNTGTVRWDKKRSNKPRPPVYSLNITLDAARPGRIFVGANPGGLYRSDNGGKTFYDKNFLTPSVVVDDPYRQGYYCLAISPGNPDEVWLGTWGKGVFKSYDAMDFDTPANGRDRLMMGKHIYQIAIDPKSPGVVYAASEEGVYRTKDGGETWEDFGNGLKTPQIRALVFDGRGALWAGSKGYGVFSRSPKEGSGWRQMSAFGNFGTFWPIWDDRPLYQYTSLLIHPDDNAIMYLGTFPAGIYKSSDGGDLWLEHNVGWTNDGVFSLVAHPQDPETIFAGTYNGINRSSDGGRHWELSDTGWPDEQWVFKIDFDPRNPDVMYACSKNGEDEGRGREGFHGTVMKSLDGGAHWFPITTGLNLNQEIYDIIVDPLAPDILYLATSGNGVFISRDAGEHWESWNEGLTVVMAGTNGNNVTKVLALSADGNTLYFGTNGAGVWRRALPHR